MNGDYCGYGSWPECTDLATTGSDGGTLVLLLAIGALLLALGLASKIRGRS